MSNMQQVLSVLVSGPSVEFDDTKSAIGNNEEYFRFSANDNIFLGQIEGQENTIVSDSCDSTSINDMMLHYLCGYSTDKDSNELSQNLVNEYRAELCKMLGVN
ncbi:MAG: hypothetical protein MUO21_11600 [Nitrososphaeraceae archaeon]|nr:hypothetical protein [Nitrososphaeraceae archaeon]